MYCYLRRDSSVLGGAEQTVCLYSPHYSRHAAMASVAVLFLLLLRLVLLLVLSCESVTRQRTGRKGLLLQRYTRLPVQAFIVFSLEKKNFQGSLRYVSLWRGVDVSEGESESESSTRCSGAVQPKCRVPPGALSHCWVPPAAPNSSQVKEIFLRVSLDHCTPSPVTH